jgi:hypothetical protein
MYFLIKNILKYKSFPNTRPLKKKKGRTMRLSTQFRTHQFHQDQHVSPLGVVTFFFN